MVHIVVDEHVCSTLGHLDELAELRDAAGRTIGYFHPAVSVGGEAPRIGSPISDEELARRRRNPGGRPLKDILEDLQGR